MMAGRPLSLARLAELLDLQTASLSCGRPAYWTTDRRGLRFFRTYRVSGMPWSWEFGSAARCVVLDLGRREGKTHHLQSEPDLNPAIALFKLPAEWRTLRHASGQSLRASVSE